MRFWHRRFLVNFAKFLKNTFNTEHFRWLPLDHCFYSKFSLFPNETKANWFHTLPLFNHILMISATLLRYHMALMLSHQIRNYRHEWNRTYDLYQQLVMSFLLPQLWQYEKNKLNACKRKGKVLLTNNFWYKSNYIKDCINYINSIKLTILYYILIKWKVIKTPGSWKNLTKCNQRSC